MRAMKYIFAASVFLLLLNAASANFVTKALQVKPLSVTALGVKIAVESGEPECSTLLSVLSSYTFQNESCFSVLFFEEPTNSKFESMCSSSGDCHQDLSNIVNLLVSSGEPGCSDVVIAINASCSYDPDNLGYCASFDNVEGFFTGFSDCIEGKVTCCADLDSDPDFHNAAICDALNQTVPSYSSCIAPTWKSSSNGGSDNGGSDNGGSDDGGSDDGLSFLCPGLINILASFQGTSCFAEFFNEDTNYSSICDGACSSQFQQLQDAIVALNQPGCTLLAQINAVSCQYDLDADEYCGDILSDYNNTCEESLGCCAEAAYGLADLLTQIPEPFKSELTELFATFDSDLTCLGVDISGLNATTCEASNILVVLPTPTPSTSSTPSASAAVAVMDTVKLMTIAAFVLSAITFIIV